jgi:hypothetical protein
LTKDIEAPPLVVHSSWTGFPGMARARLSLAGTQQGDGGSVGASLAEWGSSTWSQNGMRPRALRPAEPLRPTALVADAQASCAAVALNSSGRGQGVQ